MQEESWTKGAYWRTAINLTSMLQAEIRRQQSAAFEASAKMDERLDEERAHFMRRLERLRGRDEVAGDDVLVLRRPKTSGLSTHERIQVEEELFEAEMDRRRGAEMEAITAQHPLAYLDLDAETALSALSLLPLLQANLRRLEMSNATMASAAKVEQPSAAEDGLTEQVKMEARPSTTAPSIFGQHRENSMLGSYLLPQGQGLTSWRRTRMVKLEPTAGTNNTHEAAATTATAPTPSASSPLWWVEKAKSVRGVSSFLQYALAQQLARAQTRLEVRRNTIAAILAQRGGDGADATLFTKVWDGDDGDISTSTIALEEELAFTEEMIERNEAEYRQRMLLLADPAQMEPLPTTEAAPTQTQASYNRIVHRRSASPPPALARDEQGNHFRGDVLRSSRAAYPLKPPRFLDVELPDEDEVEAARIAALLWPEELERRIPHVLSATTSFSPRRRKRRRRGGAEHSGAEEAENGTVPSWLQQRWPNAGVAALLHVDGVGEFMASSIVLPK